MGVVAPFITGWFPPCREITTETPSPRNESNLFSTSTRWPHSCHIQRSAPEVASMWEKEVGLTTMENNMTIANRKSPMFNGKYTSIFMMDFTASQVSLQELQWNGVYLVLQLTAVVYPFKMVLFCRGSGFLLGAQKGLFLRCADYISWL